MKLKREDAALVVIDMQEKFKPHIFEWENILSNIIKLIKGASVFNMPAIATEQYPEGLGKTVDDIDDVFNLISIEKTCFSCWKSEEFKNKISGKINIILCGIEAHVCILQTALDLLSEGYNVYLVVDAVSSRKKSDKEVAVMRAVQAGAIPSTTEMLLFELLEDSKSENFKEIQKIVK
jgi:nicotinamidase-related amidase